MNSSDAKDGVAIRERAVAEGTELRERAVERARELGEGLGLAAAPTSADSPPAHPAPPVPAPPYPRRTLKETLPATPRAIARQVSEALSAVAAAPPEPAPISAAPTPTLTPTPTPIAPEPGRDDPA